MGDGDRSILCATAMGVGQLSKGNRKGIAVFPFGHTRSGSRPGGLTGDAHAAGRSSAGRALDGDDVDAQLAAGWGPEGD